VLQLVCDERRSGQRQRLILCGSSMSTMQHLLSGSQPLRGRFRQIIEKHTKRCAIPTAGFRRKETELGRIRAVTYCVQDPIVRFSQLVLAPHRDRLDERKWKLVWDACSDCGAPF
jgi:hypothetical protein